MPETTPAAGLSDGQFTGCPPKSLHAHSERIVCHRELLDHSDRDGPDLPDGLTRDLGPDLRHRSCDNPKFTHPGPMQQGDRLIDSA